MRKMLKKPKKLKKTEKAEKAENSENSENKLNKRQFRIHLTNIMISFIPIIFICFCFIPKFFDIFHS